jgi:hypothetical protein
VFEHVEDADCGKAAEAETFAKLRMAYAEVDHGVDSISGIETNSYRVRNSERPGDIT